MVPPQFYPAIIPAVMNGMGFPQQGFVNVNGVGQPNMPQQPSVQSGVPSATAARYVPKERKPLIITTKSGESITEALVQEKQTKDAAAAAEKLKKEEEEKAKKEKQIEADKEEAKKVLDAKVLAAKDAAPEDSAATTATSEADEAAAAKAAKKKAYAEKQERIKAEAAAAEKAKSDAALAAAAAKVAEKEAAEKAIADEKAAEKRKAENMLLENAAKLGSLNLGDSASAQTSAPLNAPSTKTPLPTPPVSLRPGGRPAPSSTQNDAAKLATGDKIKYSKSELMKYKEIYTVKPDALPDLTVIPGGARAKRAASGGQQQGGDGWKRGQSTPGKPASAGQQQGGSDWSRGAAPPKAARQDSKGGARDGRGGQGGRGGGRNQNQVPLYDGPIEPLAKTDKRWIPVKDDDALVVCEKTMKSILNKMTKEKFARLAKQICDIKVESYEMLDLMISRIYEKAVDEPSFGDMYANLCHEMSEKVSPDEFIKFVNYKASNSSNAFDTNEGPFFWSSNISTTDRQVVGPFDSVEDCMEAALDCDANSSYPPIDRGEMELALKELIVDDGMFIKVMSRVGGDGSEEFYIVFFAVENALESGQSLSEPFDDIDACINDSKKKNSFKFSLLNKCQDEFQKKDRYDAWKLEKTEFEVKKADLTNDERVTLEEDLEMRRIKIKKQMLGNIRFIGELYKKGMLKENILHECIRTLMCIELKRRENSELYSEDMAGDIPDEEDHEALCKLFGVVGSTLDASAKAKEQMREYFGKVQKLAKQEGLNSRIRFMYKDLIELRKSKWVARRKEETAKTLSEIRQDAAKEERQAQQGDQRGGGQRDQRGDRGGGGMGRSDFQRGNSRASMDDGRSRGESRSSLSAATSGSGGSQRVGANFMANREKKAQEKVNPAPKTVVSRAPTAPESKPAAPAAPVVMDRDKIDSKIKNMVNEWFENAIEEDMLLTVNEIATCSEGAQLFVDRFVDFVINTKDELRGAAIELFLAAVAAPVTNIKQADIEGGIEELFEFLEDTRCDVPKVFNYFADFVSALLAANLVGAPFLQKGLDKVAETASTSAADLLALLKANAEGGLGGDSLAAIVLKEST
jgi:translation initiation factor 4G